MLQSEKRFLGTSIAPLLYNAGIIFGIIVLYPQFGLIGLSYGVVMGASLHSLIQFIELAARGFRILGPVSFRSPEFKKVLSLFLPRIIGMDISQVALLFSSYFGSLLAVGSIAAYSFSYDIAAVPLSLGGVALAMATFPVLSALFAQKRHLDFLHTLQKTVSQIIWLLIPVSLFLFVFRDVVIRLLLVWGDFSTVHAETVAELLAVLSLSLVAQSLTPILSRAFYARHTTFIPVLINIFSIALMILSSFWLARSYGIMGIALAFSLVSIVNAVVLLVVLGLHMKRDLTVGELGSAAFKFTHQIVVVLLSGVGSSAIGFLALNALLPNISAASFTEVLWSGGLSGVMAVVAFLILSYMLGTPETKALFSRIRPGR
jgi:putative peptidoglycan lipid II flippase